MCLTVVPLAGPDFYTEAFGIRPLYPISGVPMLEKVLSNRPWLENLVFVLREHEQHTGKMKAFINEKYPTAKTVVLDSLTLGAPFSALAGMTIGQQVDQPIIIDLADIGFDIHLDVKSYFSNNPNVDAIVPYFESQDPKFSYLELNGEIVLQSREKQVISKHASAGVYCFRDLSTYLRAMGYALQNPEMCKLGSAYFVCPMLNGLIHGAREVHAIRVNSPEPVSSLFHRTSSRRLHEV